MKEIQGAFLGQKPIDEALDTIAKKMNDILAKENSK